jgi:hypothetical protein
MILCRLSSSGFSLSLFVFFLSFFLDERLFFPHKKKKLLLYLFFSFFLSLSLSLMPHNKRARRRRRERERESVGDDENIVYE